MDNKNLKLILISAIVFVVLIIAGLVCVMLNDNKAAADAAEAKAAHDKELAEAEEQHQRDLTAADEASSTTSVAEDFDRKVAENQSAVQEQVENSLRAHEEWMKQRDAATPSSSQQSGQGLSANDMNIIAQLNSIYSQITRKNPQIDRMERQFMAALRDNPFVANEIKYQVNDLINDCIDLAEEGIRLTHQVSNPQARDELLSLWTDIRQSYYNHKNSVAGYGY